jgi:hypothetical protein
MDMLSVLLHEYGHTLGIEHSADAHDFMATTLQPGVRRLPSAEELNQMAQLIGSLKTELGLSSTPSTPDIPGIPTPLPVSVGLAAFLASRQRRNDSDLSASQTTQTRYEVVANPQLTNADFSNAQGWSTTGTLTLTAASVLLRQIQNRAKANAAKLAALKKPPLMAAVPRKAIEGAYVTVEQLGEATELRILQEPTKGKLTKGKGIYTYQPESDTRTNNSNEDHFTYATETGTSKVSLQLQTEAGQQKITHVLHDILPNYDASVRLIVKAARNAPMLVITEPDKANEGKTIALPTLQVTAHDSAAVLSIILAQLPQGGTISDGKNTFTVTETSTVDVTDWNLNTLTFLPPLGFNSSFTLNIRAMKSREGQADVITSASVRINATPDNGNKRHPVTPASAGNARSETLHASTATAKTASITVRSVLPNPNAKPKETEIRYHVINLASSRASGASKATPVIDWTKQAELGEVREMGCLSQFLAGAKDKVRSLAEITGLKFNMTGKP